MNRHFVFDVVNRWLLASRVHSIILGYNGHARGRRGVRQRSCHSDSSAADQSAVRFVTVRTKDRTRRINSSDVRLVTRLIVMMTRTSGTIVSRWIVRIIRRFQIRSRRCSNEIHSLQLNRTFGRRFRCGPMRRMVARGKSSRFRSIRRSTRGKCTGGTITSIQFDWITISRRIHLNQRTRNEIFFD